MIFGYMEAFDIKYTYKLFTTHHARDYDLNKHPMAHQSSPSFIVRFSLYKCIVPCSECQNGPHGIKCKRDDGGTTVLSISIGSLLQSIKVSTQSFFYFPFSLFSISYPLNPSSTSPYLYPLSILLFSFFLSISLSLFFSPSLFYFSFLFLFNHSFSLFILYFSLFSFLFLPNHSLFFPLLFPFNYSISFYLFLLLFF